MKTLSKTILISAMLVAPLVHATTATPTAVLNNTQKNTDVQQVTVNHSYTGANSGKMTVDGATIGSNYSVGSTLNSDIKVTNNQQNTPNGNQASVVNFNNNGAKKIAITNQAAANSSSVEVSRGLQLNSTQTNDRTTQSTTNNISYSGAGKSISSTALSVGNSLSATANSGNITTTQNNLGSKQLVTSNTSHLGAGTNLNVGGTAVGNSATITLK